MRAASRPRTEYHPALGAQVGVVHTRPAFMFLQADDVSTYPCGDRDAVDVTVRLSAFPVAVSRVLELSADAVDWLQDFSGVMLNAEDAMPGAVAGDFAARSRINTAKLCWAAVCASIGHPSMLPLLAAVLTDPEENNPRSARCWDVFMDCARTWEHAVAGAPDLVLHSGAVPVLRLLAGPPLRMPLPAPQSEVARDFLARWTPVGLMTRPTIGDPVVAFDTLPRHVRLTPAEWKQEWIDACAPREFVTVAERAGDGLAMLRARVEPSEGTAAGGGAGPGAPGRKGRPAATFDAAPAAVCANPDGDLRCAAVALSADDASTDAKDPDAHWATVPMLLHRFRAELEAVVVLAGVPACQRPAADHTVLLEVLSALMDDRRMSARAVPLMTRNEVTELLRPFASAQDGIDAVETALLGHADSELPAWVEPVHRAAPQELVALARAALRVLADTDGGREFARRPCVLVWAALMSAASRLHDAGVVIQLGAAAAACVNAPDVVQRALLFGALAAVLAAAGTTATTAASPERESALGTCDRGCLPTCSACVPWCNAVGDGSGAAHAAFDADAECPWFRYVEARAEVAADAARVRAALAPAPVSELLPGISMQRIVVAGYARAATLEGQTRRRAMCAFANAEVWC
jgi:hypothetical protein